MLLIQDCPMLPEIEQPDLFMALLGADSATKSEGLKVQNNHRALFPRCSPLEARDEYLV